MSTSRQRISTTTSKASFDEKVVGIHQLEQLGFVLFAVWFGWIFEVLEVPYDPRLYDLFFKAGIFSFGLSVLIFVYVAVYLPYIAGTPVDMKNWRITIPRHVQASTFSGVVSYFSFTIACWPIWGFMSPLIVFVEAIGFLALFSMF
ncbi:hypothetical protein K493DRAFT_408899 [Basidiobolus meristosporus CBS 931.73]|uniref:Uncharacterized protein n=1 Tax=Basidiobolus meristosporus CBS 931.73 TaxID=1314790 RepID=A0A1Y1Y2V1_9FUNG|nr:hypothetical protein K493DRAFT_408899 [Basidiobolus meristosporus CBS 931.73]|eukprot:ORX92308.1 hypothetical protein K493DRAFT_408899 [Basidiobolus meristosporus CBS 931.73]